MSKRLLCTTVLGIAAAGAISLSATAAENIRIAFIDPLSGPFAAVGTSGFHQFQYAAQQVNDAGGVNGGMKLEIVPFDNKISPKESLIQLKRAIGEGIHYIVQGNSSGVANALTDAVNKHNKRNPDQRVLFLNYSAVDPALTNKKCNYWHFRFDANADMKMQALTDVIAKDTNMKRVYIIGQDYSFGKAVAAAAVSMMGSKRPDVKIVGNELHPIGKVKDFSPYIAKIKASDAQAVITGNWGADMLNLQKAANDAGLDVPFYTYYAAGNGITAAIGKGGVGKLRLVHEGNTNNPIATDKWRATSAAFKAKNPNDRDITQPRIFSVIGMLSKAINAAGSTAPIKVAAALEGMTYTSQWGDEVVMRADDHQLLMPVGISIHTDSGLEFDMDKSGFGLRTENMVSRADSAVATTCKMKRP